MQAIILKHTHTCATNAQNTPCPCIIGDLAYHEIYGSIIIILLFFFIIILASNHSLWSLCVRRYDAECHIALLKPLEWRHNGRDSVSNHQPHDCLLSRLFRRWSKKTSKLRVAGLCAGNSPVTGEFPAQMASNAENVSIWWRHHAHQQPVWVCLCIFSPISSNFFKNRLMPWASYASGLHYTWGPFY